MSNGNLFTSRQAGINRNIVECKSLMAAEQLGRRAELIET